MDASRAWYFFDHSVAMGFVVFTQRKFFNEFNIFVSVETACSLNSLVQSVPLSGFLSTVDAVFLDFVK